MIFFLKLGLVPFFGFFSTLIYLLKLLLEGETQTVIHPLIHSPNDCNSGAVSGQCQALYLGLCCF